MSLPTATDLGSLDFTYRGAPFVRTEAKSTIDTKTLDYTHHGGPFLGAGAAFSPAWARNANTLIYGVLS